MRIDEHLLDPDNDGPWAAIAKDCARRFRQTTGNRFNGELLEHAAYLWTRPAEAAGRIEWGFARKAVAQMRSTCSDCGAPARLRRGEYRHVVRCASCQLPNSYLRQLDWMLQKHDDPAGNCDAVWPEHQIPPLVRAAVPSHRWRSLRMPGTQQLRYLVGRDVDALASWLIRLGRLLDQDAKVRAAGRGKGNNTPPVSAPEELVE
jgi:ribosomal protein L37E